MIDNKSLAFMGLPIHFKGNSYVYPPKVKDTADADYEKYLKILTMTSEEIQDLFKEEKDIKVYPSAFKLMFKNYLADEQLRDLTNRAFRFFLHEDVTFLSQKGIIILGDMEEKILSGEGIDNIYYIDESNFSEFQNLIRIAAGREPIIEEKPNPNEDPRVTALKRKFRESHKMIEKIKEKKGEILKFEDCLAAICCMGIGITPLNIGELSCSAISVLLKTFQHKESYDHLSIGAMFGTIDTKKTNIEYWIGNSNKN